MERRSNDPAYQMHETPQPRNDEENALSAEEYRKLAVEEENSSEAVQRRQNSHTPPSEVRKAQDEHK
ncbi:MAG: hypothetical protein M3P24_09150 [Gemmatimonadota bacterium]|nr:hypothetical protein [Gemmatimonadota bacterium]